MSVIAEHLGVNPRNIHAEGNDVLPPGNIGIEIELEGGNDEWPRAEGWELKPDGSLRDGMEYVFDGPQSGDLALGSIESVSEAMEAHGPEPTFRCSTHIHIDVRDLNWTQYERLILLYMMYEDVMFDHCEPYRRMSNFCVPFMNNDFLASKFGRDVIGAASDAHRFAAVSSWPKYSALNLQTTSSFGTVEFRGSHAMFTRDELLALSQRMLHLKRFASESTAATHFDFITESHQAGLAAVFPTGLNEGYQMTEGALDQGISSAMHSLLESTRGPRANAVPEWMRQPPNREPENPDRRTMIGTQVLGKRVRWNLEALRNLNIMSPIGNPTYKNAVVLVDALNRLNGVEVKVSDIITDNTPHIAAWIEATPRRIELLNGILDTNVNTRALR